MGLWNLFKRGETADEALQAVAQQNGWATRAATGLSMLPPSHAAAGMHGLDTRNPPACGGRAYAVSIGPSQCAATVSHLEIFQSDDEQSVYDMVTWLRPAGVPRFELELGARAWQHHRLSDRFHPTGPTTHHLAGGAVLRLARDTDPALAQAWRASPGWAALMTLAQGLEGRQGCVAEGIGHQVAVFTWSGMARQGQQRWHGLVGVAEGLAALMAATG